ncbi:MAG: prephenate dehydrogenase/arogenate dehydrogenase family protein [Ardenticatenales bacterium]|nr:prephenate dehydrogenase/arogenate dehydrogenase family protein [Ardenticatenales bacterium]
MARERPPVIAIIGLGPVGTALGRALAHVRTDFRLVGHDRDAARAKAALAGGAIDEARWNLVAAVEDADLIVLTEPLDQTLLTLVHIAPHVRPGALVTDTTPVMRPVLRAAADLPAGVSFISGHPILAGRLVAPDAEEGAPAGSAEETAASPFTGIAYCIVPAASADAAAVRVLTDLIDAIGAEPYFIDADEHDALATAVDQLPHLAGAALARVLGHSPSATDIGRLMPPSMHATWLAAGRDGVDAAAAAVMDRSAVLAWLDALGRELAELRVRVEAADAAAIGAWLTEADAARSQLAPAGRGRRQGDGVDQSAAWSDIGSANPLRGLLLGRRKGR